MAVLNRSGSSSSRTTSEDEAAAATAPLPCLPHSQKQILSTQSWHIIDDTAALRRESGMLLKQQQDWFNTSHMPQLTWSFPVALVHAATSEPFGPPSELTTRLHNNLHLSHLEVTMVISSHLYTTRSQIREIQVANHNLQMVFFKSSHIWHPWQWCLPFDPSRSRSLGCTRHFTRKGTFRTWRSTI